ncbi:MAG: hypothetical protein KGJ13_10050 [Patescibacteria group bacterium]|nr:hypothetical protein [Patescibacteria group bacterium]
MKIFKTEKSAFKAGGDAIAKLAREGKPNFGIRVLREGNGYKVAIIPERGFGTPYYLQSARKNPRRKTKRVKPGRRVTAPRKTYRSAKKHTRKATTKRLQHQWEHAYESARKEGYREGDAIKIANGVTKRNVKPSGERVRKNPLKHAARKSTSFGRRTDPHIIEAIRVGPGKRLAFWYFTGHSFEDKRSHALIYATKNDAMTAAKTIRNRVPESITALRIVRS